MNVIYISFTRSLLSHVCSSLGVHNIRGEQFRNMQKQHVYIFRKHTHAGCKNERGEEQIILKGAAEHTSSSA